MRDDAQPKEPTIKTKQNAVTSSSPEREFATMEDVANYWDTSKTSVRRRIADGTLTAYRLPNSRAIRLDMNEVRNAVTVVPTAGTMFA